MQDLKKNLKTVNLTGHRQSVQLEMPLLGVRAKRYQSENGVCVCMCVSDTEVRMEEAVGACLYT